MRMRVSFRSFNNMRNAYLRSARMTRRRWWRMFVGPSVRCYRLETLKQVAERLEVHPRTLQRRLNEVDSSFQDILETVRKDMAKRYLADHSMSLAEVAFLLGYHDQSSFNRAFKEWTGESPSGFREKT